MYFVHFIKNNVIRDLPVTPLTFRMDRQIHTDILSSYAIKNKNVQSPTINKNPQNYQIL